MEKVKSPKKLKRVEVSCHENTGNPVPLHHQSHVFLAEDLMSKIKILCNNHLFLSVDNNPFQFYQLKGLRSFYKNSCPLRYGSGLIGNVVRHICQCFGESIQKYGRQKRQRLIGQIREWQKIAFSCFDLLKQKMFNYIHWSLKSQYAGGFL